MLLSIKSTVLAASTALSIAAIPAAPAFAWGDREQGFVAGVATAIIIDEILKNGRKVKTYESAPAPVYVAPTHTSIYSTPAARAFNTYSRAERKAIQRSLRSSGYYRGGLDGSFGPGTYNAIVAYARDSGTSANLRNTNSAYAVYDSLIF